MYRDYQEYMRNVLNYRPSIPNNFLDNINPLYNNQINEMNLINNYQYRQYKNQNLNNNFLNNNKTILDRPPHVKKQNNNLNQTRNYLQF